MSLPYATSDLPDGRVFIAASMTKEFAERLLSLVEDPNEIVARPGYGFVVPASVAATLEEDEPVTELVDNEGDGVEKNGIEQPLGETVEISSEPAADETPADETVDEAAPKSSSKSSKS